MFEENSDKLAKLYKTDRAKYFIEKAKVMYLTRIESPLFAPHYFPNEMVGLKGHALADKYNIKNGKDSGYGFYWPTEEDIIKIS